MPGVEGGFLPWALRGEGGRLRSGWRILLFVAVALPIQVLGASLFTGVGPGPGSIVAQTSVTLVAAVIAGGLLLRLIDRRSAEALGFHMRRSAGPEAFWGFAVGVGILLAVAGPLTLLGMLQLGSDAGSLSDWMATLAMGLAMLAVPAAAEEALFRGYPFQALTEGIGPTAAVVLFSGLFAAGHANNPNVGWIALANIFLAGLLLSLAYLRTLSLWSATGLHLGWNWAMAVALDLPVSGLELVDTPLYDVVEAGPDWITGGAFGPEAGMAGTVAFLLGMVLVWKLPAFQPSEEVRRLEPLVDRGPRRGGAVAVDSEGGVQG